MDRRVLTRGILLAFVALLIIGIQGSLANQDGTTTRYKTVKIQTTQYVWELVSGRTGLVICQAIVDHPTRPSNDETIQICADSIFPPEPTPAPLGTPIPGEPTSIPAPYPTTQPFNLADFFGSVYWRFVESRQLTRTIQVPLPEIITNLTLPPNQNQPFFVTLTAYEPVYGQHITSITGVLNGWAFTCSSARCDVPINSDSSLEFWATSSFGDDSKHAQAFLQIVEKDGKPTLTVASLAPIPLFRDACALAWGLPLNKLPAWASFPASPDDLNTQKPYQYLAGKLLYTGVVSAPECPGGGLTSTNAPNTCGMQAAGPAVTAWQNQFDVAIWQAGLSLGVPPRLIKTLFDQESQFWPGNGRNQVYEYGLGQLSQAGADVALRWDNDLFANICSGLIFDCSKIYGRLPTWMQATMRGGLVRAIDSECSTCPHGIDMARAYDSVSTVARTLRSNCLQVRYLMNIHGFNASYEDLWRYTLVSYHSGYQCLSTALQYTIYNQLPVTWENVSGYLTCPGSQLYPQELWKSLTEFDQYRLPRPDADRPVALATFAVTPTPTFTPAAPSTPTPELALSHIRVLVYVDSNGNNYPDAGEKVNGIKVTATFPDGQVLSGTTTNGELVFDLTGRPVGVDVLVSIPQLYRTQKVRVIRDGELPVTFRLEQPVVPPALP